MLGYYRAVIKDMAFNRALFAAIPSVLALSGDVGSAPKIFDAMKPLAANIFGGVIENSGHYIPEEQPEALVAELRKFFAGLQYSGDIAAYNALCRRRP